MKSLILIFFIIPLISSQPDLITIINPNNFTFVPESVEWNTASNKFVVSDIYGGNVWQIDDSGAATRFDLNQSGPNNCIGSGSFGLYYSSSTLLNVACGKFLSVPNASLPFQALYTSFSSGVLATQIDLTNTNTGAPHIPNDLRPDGQGNIYLTDSFTPQIWKITNGVPSVFLFNHSTFYPTPFLDGIEINTNKGYLIVSNLGNSSNARLIKIPINNPSAATVVNIDNNGFSAFDGPDGIRFLNSDKTILLTTDNNGPEFRILKLQSTDDWVNAKIIGSFPVPYNNPSGVVVLPNGRIYYSTANSFTPGLKYVIGRATFSSASSFSSIYSIFFFCILYLLTYLL